MALGSKLYVSLTDIDHLCDEQLERRLRESLLPKVISWLSPRANTAAAPAPQAQPPPPAAAPAACGGAANRTRSGHIIAPELKTFLHGIVLVDEQFVECLTDRMHGLRCMEDLVRVKEADLQALGMSRTEIRRFMAKRPHRPPQPRAAGLQMVGHPRRRCWQHSRAGAAPWGRSRARCSSIRGRPWWQSRPAGR